MNRLKDLYTTKLKQELMKELGLNNIMQVPKLEKIVVNSGIGSFRDNKDALDSFFNEFMSFTGQRPNFRKARFSEAGFKVRKNDLVGVTVTLRGERMWDFLEKLISVSLPRVRDFKGVSKKAFDKLGNYSIGVKEHIIFPEVDANKTKGIRSLQVNFVFKNGSPVNSSKLLEKLGLPFSR
jgi:large subunit ribosomal protein L5